ncbi:hypothetical protein HJ526_08225 [Donghicola sp. C2-DW-16]|uniref:Uncharacterized protein n=1 Tax=Donghicola mangrovi TaxID=2729614 RepID=A0ABX2PD61_9RHOB|nr:hypothetical protein [Donghicola mangrovi]NVO27400.1 hypothetical protein [Donghicola mangrovi]
MVKQLTYPDGFEGVNARWEERRDPLTAREGEGLSPLDCDLAGMAGRRMPDPAVPLVKPASSFGFKAHALAVELAGASELAYLNALLIAHLRRRSWPDHAPALFCRIWAEHADHLIGELNARWLVSSLQTFADHGQTEAQRRIGATLGLLFSMMKLYEFERTFGGTDPAEPYRMGKRAKVPLPMEMDDFSLKSGGLDFNMLAPLWRDAGADPVTAPLARHLLDMLNGDNGTVFRRIQKMRERLARREERGT